MRCTTVLACLLAAAHTAAAAPNVTAPASGLGLEGGHAMRWLPEGKRAYRLTIDGAPQPLTMPSGYLTGADGSVDQPDLGTAANGDAVVVYDQARHVPHVFDLVTKRDRRLKVDGVSASEAGGTVGSITSRNTLSFRAPDGRTTTVAFPHLPVKADDDVADDAYALELSGDHYAVITEQHDKTVSEGLTALWYGRVGRPPKPLLIMRDTFTHGGLFTNPQISAEAIYLGYSRTGSHPAGFVVRVPLNNGTLQSIRLADDRYGSSDPDNDPAPQRSISAIAVDAAGADIASFADPPDVPEIEHLAPLNWKSGLPAGRIAK